MPSKYTIDGITYRLGEGQTKGGLVDYLIQNGQISPEQGLVELEMEAIDPSEGVGISEAQAIAFGRLMTKMGVGEDYGSEGMSELRERRPIATGFGESLPYFAGGQSILGAAGIGATIEALSQRTQGEYNLMDIGLEGGKQGALSLGGRVVGEILGRTANTLGRWASNAYQGVDDLTLPSGIRTTLGKITGNRRIQQMEASAARNPATSAPFLRAQEANEAVARSAALDLLDETGDDLTVGMAEAYRKATQGMNEAIPDELTASIPTELQRQFRVLNRSGEAFDFPVGDDATEIGGRALKTIISDLKAGVRSTSASVRRRSRLALNAMDGVLEDAGANQEAWRYYSRLYGRWERLSRRGVISPADPQKINPTSAINVFEKGNKASVRSRGVIESGDEALDNYLRTMADFEQTGSLIPDSGTPTGSWLTGAISDVSRTGGLGMLTAAATSRASQNPAMGLAMAQGLPQASRGGSVAAQSAARVTEASLFPDDDDE